MKNPLREHWRLSAIEVKRIVLRKQFLLVIGVMFLLSCSDIFPLGPWLFLDGLFGFAAESNGGFGSALTGLVAGISSAAALAVDTEVGFVGLVLSRNVRRRDYLLHKAAAIFAVAVLATLIRYVWLMGMGAIVLPWDVPALTCPHDGRFCDWSLRPIPPNALEDAPGPFPALFLTHPVLNDLILIVMTALGTGVLALLGLLVGVCGGNTYLAIALPTILPFFLGEFSRSLPWWLDPTELLSFRGGYFSMLPGAEYPLGIWLAYWLGLAALLIGLSMFIAEKRELAQKVHGT